MKIKCLVVDDEPLSREIVANFVKSVEDLILTVSLANAVEAMEYLKMHEVDLIFLDINMPELSGVDFIKQSASPPAVIFITAYPEYAVEGFNLDAVDYLVKPVAYDRFLKAVDKAKSRIGEISSDKLVVKADKRTYSLPVENIHYLQSAGDYVKIFSSDQNLVVNDTMKEMELKLPASKFIRIHKSYIINLEYLQYVEGNQIKITDQLLPIGAKYRESVMAKVVK